MVVYKIRNNLNGKAYIGQTIQPLEFRWRQHCSPSSSYCRALHRAIMKYGRENFTISVLAEASSMEELNALEEELISKENTLRPNGYNLLRGGNNKRHHPETCARMSKTRTGKKVPALSYPRGNLPPEWRRHISEAKKGRPNGLKGRKYVGRKVYKTRKPVVAIRDGIEEMRFESVNEAEGVVGSSHGNISAVLKGRRPQAGGYEWRYDRATIS